MADTDYDLKKVLDTYRRDGSLVKDKARVLIEDWFDKIYPRMADPDTPTSALLDIAKVLIELGDLKPKNTTPVAQGPAFSITINVPQGDGKPPVTITGSTQVQPSEEDIIDVTAVELPAVDEAEDPLAELGPAPFKVPDFDLRDDLIDLNTVKIDLNSVKMRYDDVGVMQTKPNVGGQSGMGSVKR